MRLGRYSKQGIQAYQIYKAVGPGPFRVVDAEKALNLSRIGPIIGALREGKIIVHHDGSQMPMVKRKGEERSAPVWYFTPWAIKQFEKWIAEEEKEQTKVYK